MTDADIKLRIGDKLTKGLGAGANPDVGFGAAAESRDDIKEALGRGHGLHHRRQGRWHRYRCGPRRRGDRQNEIGALTVGVVTKPFEFEGSPRRARPRRA